MWAAACQPDQISFSAAQRIQELSKHDKGILLRLRVDAGGCSGFSYKFDLDSTPADEDM